MDLSGEPVVCIKLVGMCQVHSIYDGAPEYQSGIHTHLEVQKEAEEQAEHVKPR